MIRTLFFLALLTLAASGFAMVAEIDGGIHITLGPYQMDLTVLTSMIALAVLCFVFLALWSGLSFLSRLPHRFDAMMQARKERKGQQALTQGLVAIGAGDMKTAEACAREAERLLGTTPLALLLGAQAAQLGGQRDKADQHFRSMLALKETRLLGLRGLFVEATRQGDSEQAHRYAEDAHRLDPSSPWSCDALVHWHAGRAEWEQARMVLKKANRPTQDLDAKRRMAALLTAEAASHAPTDKKLALSLAQNALDHVEDYVPAGLLAATLLVKNNDLRKAGRLLEKLYTRKPHPDIAEAYVHLRHGDSALERLSRAEMLAKSVPGHEDSLYCLAKAELEAHHFDRVRTLLADSLADRPRMRFCLLMARLEALEHGDPSVQRDWLLRASRAPRDAAWIADGVISDHWQPVSPITGQLDAFQWDYPRETLSQSATAQDLLEAFAEDPLTRPTAHNKTSNDLPSSQLKEAIPSRPHSADPQTAKSAKPAPRLTPVGDVVFPLAVSPDDPGPAGTGIETETLDGAGQKDRFFARP
jgi:HemY protein